MIDVNKICADFPILNREVYGKQLVYLDNAATSLTPQPVVDAITRMYNCHKANVHRGVHALSQEATDRMEGARAKVRDYIGAKSSAEVIFTRGTTEAINLVASSFGEQLANGDEIILTVMEHHSNIVPWQLLQRHTRVKLNVVPVDARGELDLDAYDDCFTDNTRLVAVCHASNVLGTVNPIKRLVEIAHSHGVPILIDGAQAMPHRRVNVAELDCDFYAFSSHKMYGPNGVGVLYGKREWLEQMPPYQGGGEMIGTVSFERTTYAALPFKFEAGTPDFVDIAAFGTALDYLNAIGIDAEVNSTANHNKLRKDPAAWDVYASAMVTAPTGDPEYFFTSCCLDASPVNNGHFHSDRLEALAKEMTTAFDPAERAKLAVEMQQALLDDNGYVFCSFLQMSLISKANVTGYDAHPCDYYQVTANLDIK